MLQTLYAERHHNHLDQLSHLGERNGHSEPAPRCLSCCSASRGQMEAAATQKEKRDMGNEGYLEQAWRLSSLRPSFAFSSCTVQGRVPCQRVKRPVLLAAVRFSLVRHAWLGTAIANAFLILLHLLSPHGVTKRDRFCHMPLPPQNCTASGIKKGPAHWMARR